MEKIVVTLPHSRTTTGTELYEVKDPKFNVYIPKSFIKGKKAGAIRVTIEEVEGGTRSTEDAEPPM